MEKLGNWAISEELFKWIKKNIKEGSTILELGSGVGTIELCKYYKMYSIEHNKEWLDKSESNYIYSPIIKYNKNGLNFEWYDINYIKNELPLNYDLILIDGPPGKIGRMGILQFLDFFDLSVPIIVDDTHRKDETILLNKLNKKLKRKEIVIKSHEKKSTILL